MLTIEQSNNWVDFKNTIDYQSKKEKGDNFELLTKLYFQINPPLVTNYSDVWLWNEVPEQVKEELSLSSSDLGIDLLCKAEDGYHAIQCKYHADSNKSVTFKEVSTFLTLFESNPKITQGYICTTADLQSRNLQKVRTKNIQLILSDTWESLDEEFFEKAKKKLSGKELNLVAYQPRTHQKKALKQAKKHFIDNDKARGKLIFPCGSGKSLTGYWITEKLKAKSTIIAVPSLALVKQTLSVYLREVVAKKRNVKWLCICSDEGIGKSSDVATYTENIGVPCITDQQYIKSWLKKHQENEIYIFTTYQSGRIIGEVSKELGFTFDLGIYDEAHKTVGSKNKLFSYLLFDRNIDVRKRVFMTATERFYSGKKDDIVSMNDESVYGEIFAHMSFKEAIQSDPSLLTDYKVITLQVTDEEIADFIKENGLVQLNDKWKNETEARSLASMIALRKAMLKYPIRNAVSFHSSIEKAKRNKDIHTHLTKHYGYPPIETYTVSGKLPTTKRTKIVNEFADSEKALITNARCLTEGVDVPNIDCIVFADPKRSKIDIVQALGRALRKKDGKEWGYVVLPVIFDEEKKEVDNKSFNDILAVVRALAANDERIVDYLRDKENNKQKKDGQDDQFDFEVIADSINESKLKEELEIKLWNNIAKLNWRPFKEARDIVQRYKFQNREEFKTAFRNNQIPLDIPGNPQQTYSDKWEGWGDWLGTGYIASQLRTYLSFLEARQYIHKLNLKNQGQFFELARKKEIPMNIPASPSQVYKESGWKNWGDWLGTGYVAHKDRAFLPFEEAKRITQSLNLLNQKEYRKKFVDGDLPEGLPAHPNRVYKESGWKNWGDWLGNNYIATFNRKYRSFREARDFVHSLKLERQKDYYELSKKGELPVDLPTSPDRIYKTEWKNWGDWLGTFTVSNDQKAFLEFRKARKYVRSLHLNSASEFRRIHKVGKLKESIPSNPHNTYKKSGWISWGDWLGTNSINKNKFEYRSFNGVKELVKNLKICNRSEWRQYCKSGKKPTDVPSAVDRVYKDKGWKGWADFFGKED